MSTPRVWIRCVCGRDLAIVQLAMPNGSLVTIIPKHDVRFPAVPPAALKAGDLGVTVRAECPFGGARATVEPRK